MEAENINPSLSFPQRYWLLLCVLVAIFSPLVVGWLNAEAHRVVYRQATEQHAAGGSGASAAGGAAAAPGGSGGSSAAGGAAATGGAGGSSASGSGTATGDSTAGATK